MTVLTPLTRLDDALGRVTMYRLVTVVLAVLAAIAFGYSATGVLDAAIFPLGRMALALGVLLTASVAASRLFGLLFRVRPHTESAVITALLMWFLYWPPGTASSYLWLAGAAVLANASKYLLAVRGRHLFNPAAVGPLLTVVIQQLLGLDAADRLFTTWWVAAEALLPFVLVGALLVLRRTHRVALGAVFVAVGGALIFTSLTVLGTEPLAAAEQTFSSYPLVFLAGFMLSEPLTLPPRHRQQLAAAALAGVVVSLPVLWPALTDQPFTLWVFTSTTELSLIAANLVGFACGQRRGITLKSTGSRKIAEEIWEFRFTPAHPLRFVPGQYLELHLPHPGADRRGTRRIFSISSPPESAEVTIALRVPPEPSSFKRALTACEPGTEIRATGVSGDFVLPRSGRVLLVAGGIGITPFVSQVGTRHDDVDLVLVYGVPDASDVAYRDELVAARIPVVLVAPEPPEDLPPHWTHVAGTRIRAEDLADVIGDLAERRAHLSGPPAMVHAVRASLHGHVAGTRSDYFSGY
ncbi:MAG: hypothetical protein QM809_18455 [Gordonia sp. (in: high G+C Gram-positive bacteria)]|uniref:FAD-dependent oxidoreductase n=1 Tax=Gordonia sp. (in: high G+C Gram-positive bacteria) TaxID=84139 RepID=UPI0039E348D4